MPPQPEHRFHLISTHHGRFSPHDRAHLVCLWLRFFFHQGHNFILAQQLCNRHRRPQTGNVLILQPQSHAFDAKVFSGALCPSQLYSAFIHRSRPPCRSIPRQFVSSWYKLEKRSFCRIGPVFSRRLWHEGGCTTFVVFHALNLPLEGIRKVIYQTVNPSAICFVQSYASGRFSSVRHSSGLALVSGPTT